MLYRAPHATECTRLIQYGLPRTFDSLDQVPLTGGYLIAPFTVTTETPVVWIEPDEWLRVKLPLPPALPTTACVHPIDEAGERAAYHRAFAQTSRRLSQNEVQKVVLSRRLKLRADEPFSSKDLLVNLIDGTAHGTVLLYRYADVFFCGCTPELLVRKRGQQLESMCLAGTCPASEDPDRARELASELMADEKNRAEHEHVVHFMREVLGRICHDVRIPREPQILSLRHVQHLHTPVSAKVLEGVNLPELVGDLHPTPAVAGTPVGEAKMLIRQIEAYSRGFFAGACGYVDAAGDGEFSVGLRTGVFDGEGGWVYAGCGIVEGSVADDEFDEIDMKLKTILSAFGE